MNHARHLRRVEHWYTIERGRFAVGHGLCGSLPVYHCSEVAILLRCIHLQQVTRHFGVVGSKEHIAARRTFAGGSQVEIKWRHEDLKSHLHFSTLWIDLD